MMFKTIPYSKLRIFSLFRNDSYIDEEGAKQDDTTDSLVLLNDDQYFILAPQKLDLPD